MRWHAVEPIEGSVWSLSSIRTVQCGNLKAQYIPDEDFVNGGRAFVPVQPGCVRLDASCALNLSSTIKSIQDIMRKDDGVDGDAQRLGQLTWMLFLKVFDQREEEWEDDNRSTSRRCRSAMRWRNWAAYVAGCDGKKKPQIAASEIISFVNNELFPTLKELDANADEPAAQGDPQRL
jgi:hypothetical protein